MMLPSDGNPQKKLLCLFVQCVCLAESTIFLGLHSVRMSLLLLGHIVVTLLAFCTS